MSCFMFCCLAYLVLSSNVIALLVKKELVALFLLFCYLSICHSLFTAQIFLLVCDCDTSWTSSLLFGLYSSQMRTCNVCVTCIRKIILIAETSTYINYFVSSS